MSFHLLLTSSLPGQNVGVMPVMCRFLIAEGLVLAGGALQVEKRPLLICAKSRFDTHIVLIAVLSILFLNNHKI